MHSFPFTRKTSKNSHASIQAVQKTTVSESYISDSYLTGMLISQGA